MKKWMLILIGLTLLLSLSGCKASQEVAKMDDELELIKQQFSLLGDMPVPDDNPQSDEKVELGKKLYFDPRLSGDDVQSCASCHVPTVGFGDGIATFVGFKGVEGTRNSPTIINAGYYKENFWDGRAGSLEEQAAGPIESEVEMNQNMTELVLELKAIPEYVAEFEAVFGEEISQETIVKALAAFQRTIVVQDTAFDQFLKGNNQALSTEAKAGLKLFAGKAGCVDCHKGALLADADFHNTGISGDEGRMAITGNEADRGKFRTPGLRAITHTAPYMHDGSLTTLTDVVNFYNIGGGDDSNKDELMKPLALSGEEVAQLVAFLESLGGEVPKLALPTIPGIDLQEPEEKPVGEKKELSGKQLVEQKCVACHGANLEGSGMRPALNRIGAVYNQEQLEGIIRDGSGGMPAGVLQGSDVARAAEYLSSLK